MNKYIIALIVVIFILAGCLVTQCQEKSILKKQVNKKEVITDTVYVEKIKPVEVKEVSKPEKLKIQKKADPEKRKEVEKETINLGMSIADGKLKEQTIDTAGVIKESEHKVLPTDKISIDSKGNVEITRDKKAERKAKIKRVLRRTAQVGIFIAGIFLGSKI